MKSVIMIGAAGSGKSTFINRNFPEGLVCSSDHYHMKDGVYQWKLENASYAHQCCLRKYVDLLAHQEYCKNQDDTVIVDNTNTTIREVAPYMALGLAYANSVEVYAWLLPPDVTHPRNSHSVPFSTVQRMYEQVRVLLSEWPPYWPKFTLVEGNL